MSPGGAQSIPPGAVACSGCHPPSAGGAIPPLAGMSSEAITASMLAFRTGARPATVMDRISKGFSDQEVRAIADWFALGKLP
ncbi:cytochrome C [Phreatobacter aquaticus]|uniref:Cytochrome C n=2 Tax=Phreatobacter aquaticus TaxID=2570229 RepID=A0A4D7QU47_9HYPH|nr:cytochrome C [Phreatobacter aquaticus]